MEVYFDKLGLLSENIENEALLKVCDVHVGHSDLEHRDGKYQVIYSPFLNIALTFPGVYV